MRAKNHLPQRAGQAAAAPRRAPRAAHGHGVTSRRPPDRATFALIQIFCLQGMLIHQERRAKLHRSELQPHLSRPQTSLLVCWGLENSHPPGTWGLRRGQHPQPGLFSPLRAPPDPLQALLGTQPGRGTAPHNGPCFGQLLPHHGTRGSTRDEDLEDQRHLCRSRAARKSSPGWGEKSKRDACSGTGEDRRPRL